jgi:outer membrane protein assembly factor BamB
MRLRGAGLVLAFLLLGAAHNGVQSPPEWRQFRLNAANNAVLPGNLETSWIVRTDGGFSSSPALVDGTLYIGNNAGALYAIEVATGKTLWTFTAKAPIMANPIVVGDLVIVGEGNQTSYMTDDGPTAVGTGENAIIALGKRDGNERWRITTDGSDMPTPAMIGRLLIHHSGSGMLAAIDPSRGRVVYAKNVNSVASMSAILPLDGDRFVTAGQALSRVSAFDARDGSLVWSAAFARSASGIGDCPPASDGARVFCDYLMPPEGYTETGAGQPAIQHVYALNAGDGSVLWDTATESGIAPQYNEASIPLVHGGLVFAGSSIAPWMHAFDISSGHLAWRTQVHGVVKGGVAAKDGVIYFGDFDGYVWALEERTGRVIGNKHFDTSFNVGSPIVAGKTLILGSNTGLIIATPLSAVARSRDT